MMKVCSKGSLNTVCPAILFPSSFSALGVRVYTFMCMFAFLHGCVCTCVWRPEVKDNCPPKALSSLLETGPLSEAGTRQFSSTGQLADLHGPAASVSSTLGLQTG